MKNDCGLIQLSFGDYWDWPEDAPERRETDAHIAGCSVCSEQFRMWEESFALIRGMPQGEGLEEEPDAMAEVNRNVMNRIYTEQSWLIPPVRKSYSFSGIFRMRIAAVLATLLTVFLCSFFYTLYDRMTATDNSASGVMETANALGVNHNLTSNVVVDVPVASLSDPILLRVSPVMPEYWIALSLLGVIMTLLILNWFSRVRT